MVFFIQYAEQPFGRRLLARTVRRVWWAGDLERGLMEKFVAKTEKLELDTKVVTKQKAKSFKD